MRILPLLLIAIFFSGCASFKNDNFNSVELTDQSSYENKPSVYIDLELVFKDGVQEIAGNEETLGLIKSNLANVLNKNGLFSEYSFQNERADKMDYTLKIKVLNHGNNGAASVAGFITGYSLFIIPTYATDNYTVTTDLLKNGKQVSGFNESDSIRTWIGLWFIPVMSSNHPKDVSQEVIQNLIIRGLNELIKGKELKYSALNMGQVRVI
ncbi:MAG: hypothetical protein V7785_10840 [Bermanella sp.]